MSEIKQYDTEVRLEAVMGTNHYGVHIHAMTTEDLHSKSGIAVELAWRDLRIEQLIAQLEAAQKEIADWRSIAEAAAQDDADWHKLADKDGELICKMANAIIAVGERAKKAELELIKPLPIGELIHRLEGQTYRKWYDGDDLDKMRVRAEAAEKERDELQAEQEEHDGQIREMEGKIQLRNAAIRSRTARCERAEAALSAANEKLSKPVVLSSSTVMSRAYVVQAIKAAGFTVEDGDNG
ncbi:hypothetical protein [Yersinia frederiksenii]|uniref:hypothetical protein n=1 Tax=Yersinia frederiksenii TaxID=29484 RepID=UPI0005E01E5E|nr:hypothetical protein [Yersinia frederiksenii]CQI98180.1 Uncharacterised protein [Yersinia frederiksenii]